MQISERYENMAEDMQKENPKIAKLLQQLLFLLGVVCAKVKRAHAVAAVIVGLIVIAWMSLSPLANEGSPFYEWRSPLHTYLTIVFGTTAIFLVGFVLTRFANRTKNQQ